LAWGRAYDELSAAAQLEPLEVDDLERLAAAAYLTGHNVESSEVWADAHKECARVGDIARAARCGFWLAFALLNSGEIARGGGWIDRAQRLLDDRKLDCVEQGYLRYGAALRAVFSGDGEAAYNGFKQAAGIGERYLDAELTTLARIGEGRCLIYMGEIDTGIALLDEAMVAVGEAEVSVIATGDSYCTVIEGCREIFDIGRASEWTTALSRWCDTQPDLVLYRGQCLIHRAEILQLQGAWPAAHDEIRRACERLTDPPGQHALGAANYLRGELHRLRGELTEAAYAYGAASDSGRDPQPGLALLRLAQGNQEVAEAAIRRILKEADDPLTRARVLAAYVEILTAAGSASNAAIAAGELSELAEKFDQPYLHALAAQMRGTVELLQDDPGAALVSLRSACTWWREIDALHDEARTRVRLGLACRALGDPDGAELELRAASTAFARLGASPDLEWATSLSGEARESQADGLTPRQLEVLGLVAKGNSNREIAELLVISEKTVASHISHIFTRLGVSSRTAAAAYAFEHDLA
jgi:DNA-binding CsgD family transcriptional regulator